jgi:hypothetical protein
VPNIHIIQGPEVEVKGKKIYNYAVTVSMYDVKNYAV